MFPELREAREACASLRHFLAAADLSCDQAQSLLRLAFELKRQVRADRHCQRELLPGRRLAMLFEKPSLRTRVSFECGMQDLGGTALYLAPGDIGLGSRETPGDVARVLSRMADGIMARVFAHATVEELAGHASVPVINGLCDLEHPCQALADFLTILESRGDPAGQKVTYVGDGNNVAHSLAVLGAKLGAHMTLACPPGYLPDAGIVEHARFAGSLSGGSVEVVEDPRAACEGADVVYTDVWTSMGQEAEAQERRRVFSSYQVNRELLAAARPDHIVLHCLPAHRGEEITVDVLEGPGSRVFEQAENRLHAQKAVLAALLS